jgi:hypothetical protein
MIEYKVRGIAGGSADDMERACNELASDGWRLVSTSAPDGCAYLFFEREAEQSEPQDTWREQHGG